MKARHNAKETNELVETRTAAVNPPGINSLALLKFEPQQKKKRARAASAILQTGKESSLDAQVTLIKAKIDVGWGNALFIRGQGKGLSWEKGQPLKCTDVSTWVWSTGQAQSKVEFKLLLNDQIWSAGPNFVVEPGRRLEVAPAFAGSAAG